MARSGQQPVSVPDSDVRAIATYMASVFGAPTPDRKRQGEEVLAQVKSLPASSCPRPMRPVRRSMPRPARPATRRHRPLPYGGVNLALSTALSGPDARNAANIVLSGIRPVEGERSPIMPGFAASMSDAQIVGAVELSALALQQPAGMDRC